MIYLTEAQQPFLKKTLVGISVENPEELSQGIAEGNLERIFDGILYDFQETYKFLKNFKEELINKSLVKVPEKAEILLKKL